MKTIKTNVYQYDELSDEAKEKAREWAAEINIDYGWWEDDSLCGFTAKEQKQMKVDDKDLPNELITYKRIFFDLDRGSYLQFDNPAFTDMEIARRFLRVSAKVWEQTDKYFPPPGQSSNTFLAFEWNGDKDITPKQQAELDRAEEIWSDKVNECLSNLRAEYEWRTGREAIEDAIRGNEYTFTAEGKRFG